MCRCHSLVISALVCYMLTPALASGQLTITPTTTLTAQTANNTSAVDAFTTQANGNLGASNISKVNVHSLLYRGASTKVFAHLVLWFGEASHMNVGYSSADPVQVKRQIDDMVSRGIDGVVMVWYGPNNAIDRAAQAVMKEAESHPGFTFALMVDHGAILWDSCAGCGPQQALTAQMQYIEQTYFPSPAYLRVNGQPVVTNFDIDMFYQIDWSALSGSLSSHPMFLFQNSGGFTHNVTGGAYSWVMPTTSDFGMSYLSSFYSAGLTYPSLKTFGAAYKGFNDSLASWGMKRVMSQQCGQTWLNTFSKINSVYNSSNQLPYMQLVTWNDYEEGTEIESGIDNCVSLSASTSGNTLQWNLTGNEATVDHYNVYISEDGQNLMSLTQLPAGSRTLDLCTYSLGPTTYTLYVQASGKPVMMNHISGAVTYSPDCAAVPPSAPTITLSASPSSVTLANGQNGNINLTVAPQGGQFNEAVALACSGLPAGMSCTFAPSAVTPGSQSANSVMSIALNKTSSSLDAPQRPRRALAWYAMFLPFAFIGVMPAAPKRRTVGRVLALALLISAVAFASSCAGLSSASKSTVASRSPISPGTYSVVITGTSANAQAKTSAQIVVQ